MFRDQAWVLNEERSIVSTVSWIKILFTDDDRWVEQINVCFCVKFVKRKFDTTRGLIITFSVDVFSEVICVHAKRAIGVWFSISEFSRVSSNKIFDFRVKALNLVGNLGGDHTKSNVTFCSNSTDWASKVDLIENELILVAIDHWTTKVTHWYLTWGVNACLVLEFLLMVTSVDSHYRNEEDGNESKHLHQLFQDFKIGVNSISE